MVGVQFTDYNANTCQYEYQAEARHYDVAQSNAVPLYHGNMDNIQEIYDSQAKDTSFSLDSFQYNDNIIPIKKILGDVTEMVQGNNTIVDTIQDLRGHVQAAVEALVELDKIPNMSVEEVEALVDKVTALLQLDLPAFDDDTLAGINRAAATVDIIEQAGDLSAIDENAIQFVPGICGKDRCACRGRVAGL